MNGEHSELQQMIRHLQLSPEFQDAEALQRVCRSLQSEFYALGRQPQSLAAEMIQLTPEQQETWRVFLIFHQLLLDYSGWVNRDQWLHLVDVSADLLARGPQGDTPYIKDGTWWIGDEDTGIYASGQPPVIGPNGNWFVEDIDTGYPAQGPQGPPGVAGQGLLILGTYPTSAELIAAHPSGPSQPGGAYLVGSPAHLFIWDVAQSVWVDVGPMTAGIGEAPATADQGYMRNGLSQDWELVTHDGGTWP